MLALCNTCPISVNISPISSPVSPLHLPCISLMQIFFTVLIILGNIFIFILTPV